MAPQSDDISGLTIGPYVLDHLIGQGGFASVYAGHATADGNPVALKVLKARFGGDAQFEARFRAESEVAAQIDHPNIVTIREAGRADGHTYQVMDLYSDSLGSLIKREGPLSEDRATSIAQDVLAGLQYAHEGGRLHRDIKVDNVLLRADGSAVIADFGLPRVVSGYTSATGVDMTIGTPQYISPEQAQGREMDARSDLYSVGVTLYRTVTGEAPFHSNDWYELARMHVEDRPPSLRTRRPELSSRFERVVLKCLAKHPDDRYGSAAALLDELTEIKNASRTTETFGVSPAQTDEMVTFISTARPRWQVIAVAVLVVAAVAYLVVLFGG